MKWSFELTTIAGIRIQVHTTFFLLLAWIALSYWQLTGSLVAVLDGVLFIIALFACVVLHELGHALTARRFGIRTRSITLLPIGGVAAIDRNPDNARQELLIAAAGPLVSLIIALLLYAWLAAGGDRVAGQPLDLSGGPFLQRLMIVNFMLALFNLVPAFPMDGGRILRALLSLVMEPLRATRVAAGLGQLLALAFALLGLMFNPFLFLIAVFIWFGATAEAGAASMKSALENIPASRAMLTDFRVLAPTDRLGTAVALTLAGSQKDFPVLQDGAVVGVLGQNELVAGLHQHGPDARVGDSMRGACPQVDADTRMAEVLEIMQKEPGGLVAVSRGGLLLGLLTFDNVLELIRLKTALDPESRAF